MVSQLCTNFEQSCRLALELRRQINTWPDVSDPHQRLARFWRQRSPRKLATEKKQSQASGAAVDAPSLRELCCFELLNRTSRGTLLLFGRVSDALVCCRLAHFVNFNCELDGIRSRFSAEVVHASLQSNLPTMEVHGRKLGSARIDHVDVQRLGLVDVGTPVRSHVENNPLLDLPDCLVQLLQIGWEVEILNAAVVSDELHAQVLGPQLALHKIPQQVPIHLDELPGQHAPHIQILRVRLERLVVPKDLRSACSWHRGNQQRVTQTVLGNSRLQVGPVPTATARGAVPQVELQLAFTRRGTSEGLIRALQHCEVTGRIARCEIDCLEDVQIQLPRSFALERQPHQKESIGQSLDSQTDWPMRHV